MAEGECKAVSLLFRIAALGLSVAAAIVMATASQVVVVGDGGTEPSSYSSVSYNQYNALRYFVAGVAISAVVSAAALYLFAVRADTAVGSSLPLMPFLDAAAQGFLFSASGAAFAARDVLGLGGSSVCDAAGAFCGRVTVAAAVCAFAAVSVAVAAALARNAGHGTSGGRRCDWG